MNRLSESVHFLRKTPSCFVNRGMMTFAPGMAFPPGSTTRPRITLPESRLNSIGLWLGLATIDLVAGSKPLT